ncbi:uncharacterized protein LOC128997137 [Macrosteles quadrilineatus]|uniref:uncharacterized protein LOC128997137 n=1 Tax=Macrosteles quadrilineatus TaxID=74068 RepID=UPI0023E2183E|nr:uncharacterized protein LOC128997137 [Macrosteles quadrilineatus]
MILSKTTCAKIRSIEGVYPCGDALYDDSTTATAQYRLDEFEVDMEGPVKGFVVSEHIWVEGSDLFNKRIGVATTWSPFLVNSIRSGMFHGYFGISPKESNVPFTSLLDGIRDKHFGLYLNFKEGEGVGELRLGGIDASKIEGGEAALKDVPIVPTDDDGWAIIIDSISINGQKINQNQLKVLVDTSMKDYYGKKEIITKINQALGANNMDTQDLEPIMDASALEENKKSARDNGASEADIRFLEAINKGGTKESTWHFNNCGLGSHKIVMTINNENYELDPTDYMTEQGVLTLTFDKNGKSKAEKTGGRCISNFKNRENERVVKYDLTLGTLFFNKYYAVFDVANGKIRLGKKLQ